MHITPATVVGLRSMGLDVSSLAERVRKAQAVLAKGDPNIFVPFVLRDEETGKPVLQAPYHREWQDQVTANARTVLLAHIESGKTQQLSIGRALYELGENPRLRCVVVSSTADLATKIVRSVQSYIAERPEASLVYPHLRKGTPWTPGAFNIAARSGAKDYSFQAIGIGGAILGARIDLLILDDVLDWENTRTDYQRQKVRDWVFSTLFGRLTANARVIAVGNPWHPSDLLHELGQRGWPFYRYAVLDAEGEPAWPQRWPKERILQWTEEFGPLEAARQLMCQVRADGEARFKREWIEQCMDAARAEGATRMVHSLDPKPGWATYTGVDLAVGLGKRNDLTVLFTIAVSPDQRRQVLEIQSGRWTSPEIVQRIHDAHRRYRSIVLVESNAAQQYLVQFAQQGNAIPIRPFLTGRNKLNPALGVESLATEMAQGKWLIPNHGGTLHPEVSAWIDEMLYYQPDAHTGDRLMACWIAREGARAGEQRPEYGSIDLLYR